MAKSYKSALPTWTTYTPYVNPLSTQAPINQEVLWRNRAHGLQPFSTHGAYQRIAMNIDAQVKGTGAQHVVGGILQHRPISKALPQGNIRNLWAQRMQESVQQGTPETMVEPGETDQQTAEQVQAARTAPATVLPTDVQTQQNARAGVETLSAAAAASAGAGTDTLGPRRYQNIFNAVKNFRSQ